MTRYTKAVSLFAGAVLFISACERVSDTTSPRGARSVAERAAFGGVPILQGFGTAVVDGVLDAGEWDPSASLDFVVNLPAGYGTANGTLYVMNDRTNLYLALRIDGLFPNHNQFLQFAFDNDNDGGTEENGDDLLVQSSVTPNGLFDGWTEIVPPCLPGAFCANSGEDIQSGGTLDGAASLIKSGGISVVELVHPLNSLDDLHDFSLAIGDTVGFSVLLQILDQQVNIGSTTFPDGAPWGKIVIADLAPLPPPPPTIPTDIGSVSAGMNFTCAIAVSDTVYCWGANDYGALGNKSTVSSRVPVMVWSYFTYASVSAGSAAAPRMNGHACAVTTNGEAHCWGGNTFGQLGNGGTFPIDTATPVITMERFKSISAGQEFTCGVTISGSGLCWGFGGSGQLGDGKQTGSILPVAVSGNLTFERISAGAQHACGVTTNGDVYCWGANHDGQLGLGTQGSPHLVPQLVTSGFRSVSAGVDHSCGLNDTGTVYCWGANQFGQIGDGTLTRRLSPVAVGGGYASVDVGGSSGGLSPTESHTCAVSVSGDAYCWGGNASGQLGDGLPVPAFPYWLPTAVVGGHHFRNVSAGASHSCGVTLAGDTYCWGSSGSGELGVPKLLVPHATPVLVSGGLIFR